MHLVYHENKRYGSFFHILNIRANIEGKKEYANILPDEPFFNHLSIYVQWQSLYLSPYDDFSKLQLYVRYSDELNVDIITK